MNKKKHIVELIQLYIQDTRILDSIEKITGGCELLSCGDFSIIYLMGLDLDLDLIVQRLNKKADDIMEKYTNIFSENTKKSELSNNEVAHLVYSQLQDEITKDLKKYPFLKVSQC